MRNGSLGLATGMIGNLYIITRGLIVREHRPRNPVQTGSTWRWLVTTATWAILTSSGVGAQQADKELIEEGRRLFFEETFNGNGRTCGTCHPATNNFTIDPEFVRRLPGNNPLFIAKGQGLKDLEIKQFLNRALILENLDTFNNAGVMRGVPHTLALRTSEARMGWSGDGSPGDGSLRSFAIGAVRQHFPKTLARVPGVDFRLPTDAELDALAAFQRNLGRQTDIVLADLPDFNDATVERGRELFDDNVAPARGGGTRRCSGCHENAGTNNERRATGVNNLTTAPACVFGVKAPGDGGFGLTESTMPRRALCGKGPNGGPQSTVTFRGDESFDVPPVIEAADTPPFFHNNAVATLEDAVAFYTSDTFNDSIAGDGRAFILTEAEINAIGAFLRALNALENIRSSNTYDKRAFDASELAPEDELVELAIAETTDAIEVLTEGPIKLYPDAVALLREARQFERQAAAQNPPNAQLLQDAIGRKEAAHDQILAP
jgi:cytochrome c peroxidase